MLQSTFAEISKAVALAKGFGEHDPVKLVSEELLRRRGHPGARFIMATGRTFHLIGLLIAIAVAICVGDLILHAKQFYPWVR